MCNLIWEMTSWYQWHEIDTNHGTAKRGRWGQCWPHPCAASNLNSSRSLDFRGQCLSLRWDDLLIRLTDDIILLKTIFFHALDCTSMLQVHYYHYTLIQQKKMNLNCSTCTHTFSLLDLNLASWALNVWSERPAPCGVYAYGFVDSAAT